MQYLIQSTIAIIAIMDPLGAAPIFLGLTDEMTRWQRTRAAVRASFYCIVILTVSAFGGEWILRAFGVTLPAFQVAGGLIIVLMGLEMLSGTPTRVQHDPKEPGAEDTILVPFAMPL
ncbi:MAG: MarC family protein, partial [Proteobacteria bacterium]|nr:MarC family protein [Pseudomonadota bacterium]